ncbi:ankyrin repeat domain protein [Nitzschia inconspicua]|uniref:Ankyrin repeat domain protein n=1 Tax=Nitzschia inconspicua TaxID=303405 RepID=A0A9K3L090_9STRA|nr:ankyrin repeat domain protein [Nitzschia inconspicua]
MDDNLFHKLPNEDTSADLGDLNPFSDSAGPDLFEKLMEESAQKSLGSINSNNSFSSGLIPQDLLESELNKSHNALFNTDDMETEPLKGDGGSKNDLWDVDLTSASPTGGKNSQHPSWFKTSDIQMPMNSLSGESALDAAPLNISLGGMGGSRLSTSGSNQGFGSTLRRKGSNPQLNASFKYNSIHKAGSASTNFKSSKSEGLLARALKAKYNSSGQINYNMNAQAAAAIAEAGGSNSLLNHSPSLSAIGSGRQNASWRGVSERSGSSSMLHQMLLNKNRNRSSSALTSCDSTSALFNAKLKLGSSRSKSSMQDLLRLSRVHSKTQSMLRQSSAQSLMRQTSTNSLRDSGKVDLSSLLPPQHANSRKHLNSTDNLSGSQANATFPVNYQSSMGNNIGAESLLHQSCRLYPMTDAVVESALRIDPAAVRRAIATSVDEGATKKATNIYGYPINVALSHGASLGVVKMLAEAGPDVLIQKDGTTGSGSLGIALATKCSLEIINLLIQANPQCAQVADRRGNYPLHVAVSQGLPLLIVRRVYFGYPKAQEMRNFHSDTPLDIAQRSTRCPEDVMNFLQSSAYSKLEHVLDNVDQIHGNLEDGLDDIMQTNF